MNIVEICLDNKCIEIASYMSFLIDAETILQRKFEFTINNSVFVFTVFTKV